MKLKKYILILHAVKITDHDVIYCKHPYTRMENIGFELLNISVNRIYYMYRVRFVKKKNVDAFLYQTFICYRYDGSC